jgi:hypothetical protein
MDEVSAQTVTSEGVDVPGPRTLVGALVSGVLILSGPAVALAAVGSAPQAVASAARLPAPPHTPREPRAIEGFAPYQPQFFCRSRVEPGVAAFEHLVLATYPNTHTDGDMRACAVAGTSEHKDGRAWDWAADHRRAKQRAAGESLLRWLFAPDKAGAPDAMFRRLGLMYVIWNKRIWGAWSRRWEPYSCSGVTACHVNHMHFSFGWAGAERRTSFWTHKVGRVREPPLPYLAKRGTKRTLRVPARAGSATAMWLVRGGLRYRVVATGVWRHGKSAADAACHRTTRGWVRSGGAIGISGDRLAAPGLAWVPTHDNGRGCNPVSHKYRLVLTTGHSSTVIGELSGAGGAADAGAVQLRFVRPP